MCDCELCQLPAVICTDEELLDKINRFEDIPRVSLTTLPHVLRCSSSLHHLHIRYLTEDLFQQLMEFLKSPNNLKSIKIRNIQNLTLKMDNIVSVIRANPSIETLEICASWINFEGMKILSEELKINTTLKHLMLIETYIDCKTADLLADAVVDNTTLRSLKINVAYLDNSNIFRIFVRNNTLREFSCSSTNIEDHDLDHLANSLENNTALEHLDLRYNIVKSSKIVMVLLKGSAITHINTSIAYIDDNYEVVDELIKMHVRMRRQYQKEIAPDTFGDCQA